MPNANDENLLIFRIDRIPCAVPAASIDAIVMPPAHLTQPPGSDRTHPGIFRHASQVHAVIDLHERFGIDTARKGVGRFLLHHSGLRHYAFWVDEVVGLARGEEGEWAALAPPHPPPLLAMRDAGPIHSYLQSLAATEAKEQSTSIAVKTADHTGPHPAPKPLPTPQPTPHAATGAVAETKQHAPIPRPSIKTISRRPAMPARPPAPEKRSALPPRHPVTKAAHRPSPTSPLLRPDNEAEAPPLTPQPANDVGQGEFPWPLLLLLLAAIGGTTLYLWPEETRVRPAPQPTGKHAESLALTATSPGSLTVVSPTTPPAEPPTPAVPPAPVALAAPAPGLQIEEDAEGTLSLIIERSALTPPQEIAIGGEQAEDAAPPITPPPIARQDTTEEEKEPPLQPEADWPKPVPLEPCDCVYIVVQGDTLWAIAQRYTNNAFNYPALAKSSGIRNPHRIYPGQRIRIIIR